MFKRLSFLIFTTALLLNTASSKVKAAGALSSRLGSTYHVANSLAYWGASAAILGTHALLGYRYRNKYRNDYQRFPKASAQTQTMVKRVAKSLDMQNSQQIVARKIRWGEESLDPAFTCDNQIFIDEDFFGNDKKLKKFVTGHELAHIKNNDNSKRFRNEVCIPIATHCTMKLMNKGLEKGSRCLFGQNEPQSVTPIRKALSFISDSAITKLIINISVILSTIRRQERNADKKSATALGPKVATAAHDYFKREQEYRREHNIKVIDPLHPTPAERMAYLER